MIYLDAAATTLQKPPEVRQAVLRAMETMASPGRGGHRPAMLAAETAFRCRCTAAELFHVPQPEQVVFTMNATHGLNIAIHSLIQAGDRVVVSGYEHNSVMRPLHLLGAEIRVAGRELFAPEKMAAEFAALLPGAKAAICTTMSNVFGYRTPIEDIAESCRKNGVPLIIDASQSAGNQELDFEQLAPAFMAMPGHKGLLGPQGTGLLLCGQPGIPLMAGGTGSESRNPEMPDYLPDRLEAGTHNVAGIAGLLTGMQWIQRRGCGLLGAEEGNLIRRFGERIEEIPGLEVFLSENPDRQGGVLSVRHRQIDGEYLAEALGNAGVAVRAGLHCAPVAHENAGTGETGTVRFSVSPFNTPEEMEQAAEILRKCVKKLSDGIK